jgi:hypothetical protein
MLIYEFQGVVCVDGLVLGSSEFHFGNDLKIKLGDEAEERKFQTRTLPTSKVRHPREFLVLLC